MNLHEYQSKELFAAYRLPIPRGIPVRSLDEADAAAREIGGDNWVVKAQVHAGGRGQAGGVRIVKSRDELRSFVQEILGKRLVTKQTDSQGQPIDTLLIEERTAIDRELYLGALVDRGASRVVFLASAAGGMDIEEVAERTPEKIHKVFIDPLVGALPYQGRRLGFQLGLEGPQLKQFVTVFMQSAKLFVDKDLSLMEINPLVKTREGGLLCLDGKIVVDNNALFRQKELSEQRDHRQEDERENRASEHGLSYVALEGNIGCLVNGAGLAMATMDIIKSCGGEPANFLDVGGTATPERVAEAFRIILSDDNVRVIFVNIFGGIVRCDIIAQGLIAAMKEVKMGRLVVRLEGNRAAEAMKLLEGSDSAITTAPNLEEAARKAVALAAD